MPFLNRALLQYASVDLEAGHSKEVVNIRMGQRHGRSVTTMHLISPICRAPWLVPLVSRGTPQIIRTAVSPINYGEEAQVLDSSSARKFAMRREIIAETC